jgi:hypothetical protein
MEIKNDEMPCDRLRTALVPKPLKWKDSICRGDQATTRSLNRGTRNDNDHTVLRSCNRIDGRNDSWDY